MKKSLSLILSLALALALSSPALAEPADAVVSGKIYTSDEARPWAEAMAVRDGKFVYVGDAAGAEEFVGENTEVVTRDGGMITPGLFDAHTHPASVGRSAWHVKMGLPDYDGIISFITRYLAEHDAEEAPFVYFEYYPTNLFGPEGPNKAPLDEIAPDRPILVRDFSDHASWVNSKCLELLGVYDLDPSDHRLEDFVRDENGDFTGCIRELGFGLLQNNMFEALGWYPPDEPTPEVMSVLTDDLKKWGVTGVFDGFIEHLMQPQSVHDLDAAGKLNMYYDMKWAEISKRSIVGLADRMIKHYEGLELVKKKDPLFLYNYAAELNVLGDYQKSVDLTRRCAERWDDYDVQIMLASNYAYLHDKDNAVKSFDQASCMIPCRFEPLYGKMTVYVNCNDTINALRMANDIVEKPIKVRSGRVSFIVEYARQVLDKYD